MRRLAKLGAWAAVTALLVVACGSDDDEEPDAVLVEESTTTESVPVADPLALEEGESVTFAVEVVVTENPTDASAVGNVLWAPNCYTLSADGTFDDPGFPTAEAPVLGSWENRWDGTTSSYVAQADGGGLNLEQTGSVTVDETTGDLQLTAETTLSTGESLVAVVTSRGPAVESCTPMAG
jgi:hypothetical protein